MELNKEPVVFCGKPSKENVKYLEGFDRKRIIFLFVIFIISIIILAFSVAMLTNKPLAAMLVIYIILSIITGIIVLYGLIVCFLYEILGWFDLPFFKACYFDNQRVTVSEWGVEVQTVYDPAISIDVIYQYYAANSFDIKKVYDLEDFYIIIAGKFYKKGFICQKDLLTSGTLEEFKSFFEGKIVRID